MVTAPVFSVFPKDIRHPEELSLLRPVEEKKKKKDKEMQEQVYDLTEVPLTVGEGRSRARFSAA